jgi:dihydroneopterin aldolase
MPKRDTVFADTTYITIDDLHVLSTHGHYPAERRIEQEFSVSLTVEIDAAKPAKSDNLADTLDYDAIRELVLKIFKKKSRYLLEALAHDIAEQLMKESRLTSVDLSIKKLSVWKDGVPGVRVLKKRLNT